MLELIPPPKIITFDCYGTLVRWHQAIETAASAVLSRHLPAREAGKRSAAFADRLRLAAAGRQRRGPFRNYKCVLGSSLTDVLAEGGYAEAPADQSTFLNVLHRIEPHPEVPAALARLRTRFRLAVISNTDDDLIAGTIQAIGTPIDFVITAEQARAYKPDPRLFLHAHRTMSVTREETLHVAMGQFTDLKVCHELGIRCVWIDRAGETPRPEWAPVAMSNDLAALPDLLASG